MRPVLVLLAGTLACTPGGDEGGDDNGDEKGEDTGATTDAEIPEPAFLNPAIGEFSVLTDQTVPEPFVVQRVIPGLTQVLLDGSPLGTLSAANPLGALGEDSLELTLRGALVAGTHSLQLVNPSPEGPRNSVTLTMVVAPPKPDTRPSFSHALEPTDLADIAALLPVGAGDGRLLGLVGPGDPDPALRLLRPDDGGGWTADKPILVPLDGHVQGDMSFGPAVAAVAYPEPDGSPARRMRVAWRVGQPGHTVTARDIALNPTPIVLDAFPVFTLADALAGEPVEYAALERPFLVGRTLLVETVAALDSEVPHPGDRRVYTSFWRDDVRRWSPPQRIGMPAPTDLDALGPAPVVADIAASVDATLSVRLGGVYPGLLEARDDGTVALTTPDLNAPLAVSGALSLAAIASSFGSRSVVALDRVGRLGVTYLDTSGSNPARDVSPDIDELPDAAPTGPLAPGVVRGFTVFLVPYGDQAPVHLVLGDGSALAVQPLADPEPLHCDAVALAPTLAGNDPQDPALALACLSHGALELGRLIATPAPE
ncbi:MAG: hypothetical protein JNL82_13075 [Myxococcales bacterium]|nr:hypothetical protein [Myxococcales bacterium]